MTITRIAVIALILAHSAAGHAQVYKWVDDQGVTHYGATPPRSEPSEPRPEQNVTRILHREERPPAFHQVSLYGTWWGRLDNRILALEFERDQFEVRSYDGAFQPHRSLFAAGRYEQGADGVLHLHYRYNRERPHLVGRHEALPIQVVSAHQWRGDLAGAGEPVTLRKQLKRSSTEFDRRIYGAWIDTENPHSRYRFSLGAFIKEHRANAAPHRWNTVSIANYFWDDPKLRMEPVISQQRAGEDLSNLEEYWELESLADQRLRIKNLNTGQSHVLKRD